MWPNIFLMTTLSAVPNPAAPAQNGPFGTASAAVAAFTADPQQLHRLVQIAARRLDRLACQPPGQRLRSLDDPLGYVHDALAAVLSGQRQIHPRHLLSSNAFFNFLQGVLHSRLSNALKAVVTQGVPLPIGPEEPDSPYLDPPGMTDVVQEVSHRETLRELSARLEQSFAHNPPMLHQVHLVEQSGLDGLPDGHLTAQQQHRFRKRAQALWRQISAPEAKPLPS
jgi:hypothetical protein